MRETLSERQVEAAADMFGALADVARLKTLILLSKGELSVSAVAEAGNEKVSTVSARLQLLYASRLVARERRGKSILYRLADAHVLHLIENAVEHACEHDGLKKQEKTMSNHDHKVHEDHPHQHGAGCGHTAVKHDGHVDYLHDGHLHHPHGDHVDEHVIEVSDKNPDRCTPKHDCGGHEPGHVHGPGCGHEAVPHGDHVDYLVNGHLHHPHGDHCDDHGPLEVVQSASK